MEKQSAGGNETGGLRLPIGFRFYPTDAELVVHYLRRKAFNYPLAASIITELDALRADPRDLPGDWKEKRYFFGNREWNGNKTRSRVVASGRGCWKPFGKETKIPAPGSNMVIGFKRSLAFYESGKRLHGTKTPWLMHEFRLASSKSNPNSSQNCGEWVVYCIFQKKAGCSRNRNDVVVSRFNGGRSGNMEEVVMVVREDSSGSGPPRPSSSGSSGVAVASSNNGSDQEESSTLCVGLS